MADCVSNTEAEEDAFLCTEVISAYGRMSSRLRNTIVWRGSGITCAWAYAFCMVVSMLAASGCGPSSTSMRSLKASSEIVVYEGLPHPLREADTLAQEKQRPDIAVIGGFHFYTPGVKANAEQKKQIKNILGDGDRYYTRGGEPTDCGPFHPDYAVEWTVDGLMYYILVCFSCDEAWIMSGNEREEFNMKGTSDVESIFSKFSAKRP